MIKTTLFSLLIFLFVINLSSCSDSVRKKNQNINIDSIIYKPGTNEPFNGTWKGETDSIKLEFDVVNGKKEGNFRVYYPNGKIQISGKMKNNRNTGEWKYFYENGNLESSGFFVNDVPDGKWLWYYPDETLKQIGYYRSGKRDSLWKTYDSTGVLIDSTIIKNDTTVQKSPL